MTEVLGNFSVSDLQVFYSIKILTSGRPRFHPVERQRGGTAVLRGAVRCCAVPPQLCGAVLCGGGGAMRLAARWPGGEVRAGHAFLLLNMVTPMCMGDGDELQAPAAQGSGPSKIFDTNDFGTSHLVTKWQHCVPFLFPFA